MSLGLLVGRFGTFLRENHVPPPQEAPEPAFPDHLAHVREAVAHHLIPLLLLARTDRDFAPSEREVIVGHCVALVRRQGAESDEAEAAILNEYIDSFRPSLMQLDPALSRLSHCPHDEVVALVDIARRVVEADGEVRAEEARFLAQLGQALDELSKSASRA